MEIFGQFHHTANRLFIVVAWIKKGVSKLFSGENFGGGGGGLQSQPPPPPVFTPVKMIASANPKNHVES